MTKRHTTWRSATSPKCSGQHAAADCLGRRPPPARSPRRRRAPHGVDRNPHCRSQPPAADRRRLGQPPSHPLPRRRLIHPTDDREHCGKPKLCVDLLAACAPDRRTRLFFARSRWCRPRSRRTSTTESDDSRISIPTTIGRPLPPAVVDLRARIAAADAILFSTPEYAGAMPGSFKNLLDWTVGGVEMSHKPSAWINISPTADGALRYARIIDDGPEIHRRQRDRGCVARIPVPRTALGTKRPDRRPSPA